MLLRESDGSLVMISITSFVGQNDMESKLKLNEPTSPDKVPLDDPIKGICLSPLELAIKNKNFTERPDKAVCGNKDLLVMPDLQQISSVFMLVIDLNIADAKRYDAGEEIV